MQSCRLKCRLWKKTIHRHQQFWWSSNTWCLICGCHSQTWQNNFTFLNGTHKSGGQNAPYIPFTKAFYSNIHQAAQKTGFFFSRHPLRTGANWRALDLKMHSRVSPLDRNMHQMRIYPFGYMYQSHNGKSPEHSHIQDQPNFPFTPSSNDIFFEVQ